MKPDSDSNSDAWRGALIALALGSMFLGVFVLFAYGRTSDDFRAIKRHFSRLVEIFDRPEQEKGKSSMQEKVKVDPDLGVPPSPGRGFDGPSRSPGGGGKGGSGNSSTPSGGGTGDGGSPLPPRNYTSPGEALKGVLETYRLDPKKTGTITISTNGKVAKETKGELTAYGLPAQAVQEGIVVTGASATK